MSAPRGTLIVFAKQPVSGAVKTRMVPPLTPAQAAEFYGCLLDDVIEASAAIADACDLDPVLAVAPASACESMAARCPDTFRVVEQRGADLGARMECALEQAADQGASPILLRGSDSPTLDRELVAAALDALQSHDLVVCPDRDGGYSLIGLGGAAPGLFSHPMSTCDVLEDTLAGARSRGWRTHLLPARFDLDRIDDLRWLAEARSETVASLCPRTLAYLDDRALWPPV